MILWPIKRPDIHYFKSSFLYKLYKFLYKFNFLQNVALITETCSWKCRNVSKTGPSQPISSNNIRYLIYNLKKLIPWTRLYNIKKGSPITIQKFARIYEKSTNLFIGTLNYCIYSDSFSNFCRCISTYLCWMLDCCAFFIWFIGNYYLSFNACIHFSPKFYFTSTQIVIAMTIWNLADK